MADAQQEKRTCLPLSWTTKSTFPLLRAFQLFSILADRAKESKKTEKKARNIGCHQTNDFVQGMTGLRLVVQYPHVCADRLSLSALPAVGNQWQCQVLGVLNVRASASTTATPVGQIPRGAIVTEAGSSSVCCPSPLILVSGPGRKQVDDVLWIMTNGTYGAGWSVACTKDGSTQNLVLVMKSKVELVSVSLCVGSIASVSMYDRIFPVMLATKPSTLSRR
jgi:hypothetical protein